jgi:hypothetical protein
MKPDVEAQPEKSGGCRRDLQSRLVALGAFVESRGSRFARRKTNGMKAKPKLADIVNLPDWILCAPAMVNDIAAVTALLHFRHAIDQELSGPKLRAICDTVGEAYYDLACETCLPPENLLADVNAKLPSPDQMIGMGRDMLDQALPLAMAPKVNKAYGDMNMRHLSNLATAIVVDHHSAKAGVSA